MMGLAYEQRSVYVSLPLRRFNCKRRISPQKTRDGIYQLKDPEPSEEDMPETDDATYAELLREVWETLVEGTTSLRRTYESGVEWD